MVIIRQIIYKGLRGGFKVKCMRVESTSRRYTPYVDKYFLLLPAVMGRRNWTALEDRFNNVQLLIVGREKLHVREILSCSRERPQDPGASLLGDGKGGDRDGLCTTGGPVPRATLPSLESRKQFYGVLRGEGFSKVGSHAS